MQGKNNLIGINIDCLRKDELDKIFDFTSRLKVAKVNTEFLARALRNKDFFEVLNRSNVIIADGKGVLWAAKYMSLPLTKFPLLRELQAVWQMIYSGASLVLYPPYCQEPIKENIPGMEALFAMLKSAEKHSAKVYFLGSTDEVLKTSLAQLVKKFPKLKIAGYHNGYDEGIDDFLIDEINQSEAKLLIVAMGSPKQEYWIDTNFDKLATVKVAVGEGGSLEFLAGNFRRAPFWMQLIGLEWLWRLLFNKSKTHQVGSRAKRVWNAVPLFILEMVKYKLRNK